MTFDLNTAKKIALHYSYLIGQDISENFVDYPINHIVVAPTDQTQFSDFIINFNQNKNNEAFLLLSGFDKSKMKVILINHDTYRGDIFHYNLEKYLEEKQIKKVYLNSDF